jgi:hypothetical protein
LSIKKVELCIVKTDARQKMSNLPMSHEAGACTASTPPLRELELRTLPVRQQCSSAGGRPSHRGCCARARHEKGRVNPAAAARGLCECRARARADVGRTACVMHPAAAGHSQHSTSSAAPGCSRMPVSRLRAPLLDATAWVAQVGPTASAARSRG